MPRHKSSLHQRIAAWFRRTFSPERQNGYGRTVLPTGMILIVLLIVAAAVTVTGSVQIERQARERSIYTSGIIKRLDAVQMAAIDAETALRGYLLTGQRRYLAPWRAASQDRERRVDDLKTFALDTAGPQQERWIMEIGELMSAHFADADETVRLVRQGDDQIALERFRSGEGKARMDRLRVIIRDYGAYEERQLVSQIQAADRYEQLGSRTLYVIGGLLFALLALVAYLMWRNLRLLKTEADLIEVSEAKEQIELISRELNHRVKNLFAIVMAIISMTARREKDVETAGRITRERVAALAAAHQLTLDDRGVGGLSLKELVDTVLSPYASDRYRFTWNGQDMRLPSRMATPVGLALHELATNAVKYGAWSTEQGGSIAVTSAVGEDPAGLPEVTLCWTETGGPQVFAPDEAHSGFGSVMIEQGMRQIKGRFEKQWERAGLVATLTFVIKGELAQS